MVRAFSREMEPQDFLCQFVIQRVVWLEEVPTFWAFGENGIVNFGSICALNNCHGFSLNWRVYYTSEAEWQQEAHVALWWHLDGPSRLSAAKRKPELRWRA